MDKQTKNQRSLKVVVKNWIVRNFQCLIGREKKTNANELKEVVKNWIVNIDKTETLPSNIVALCFNIEEDYGLEMVGSTWFDEEDEDWACDDDDTFVPAQRSCPNFKLPDTLQWEEVLEIVVAILKDLTKELADLSLFKVEHIATGFVDGNLIIIK